MLKSTSIIGFGSIADFLCCFCNRFIFFKIVLVYLIFVYFFSLSFECTNLWYKKRSERWAAPSNWWMKLKVKKTPLKDLHVTKKVIAQDGPLSFSKTLRQPQEPVTATGKEGYCAHWTWCTEHWYVRKLNRLELTYSFIFLRIFFMTLFIQYHIAGTSSKSHCIVLIQLHQ